MAHSNVDIAASIACSDVSLQFGELFFWCDRNFWLWLQYGCSLISLFAALGKFSIHLCGNFNISQHVSLQTHKCCATFVAESENARKRNESNFLRFSINEATQQTHTYTHTSDNKDAIHHMRVPIQCVPKQNQTIQIRLAHCLCSWHATSVCHRPHAANNNKPTHTHIYTYNSECKQRSVNKLKIWNMRRLQVWIVSDRYVHESGASFRFTYMCMCACVCCAGSAGWLPGWWLRCSFRRLLESVAKRLPAFLDVENHWCNGSVPYGCARSQFVVYVRWIFLLPDQFACEVSVAKEKWKSSSLGLNCLLYTVQHRVGSGCFFVCFKARVVTRVFAKNFNFR